MLDLADLQLVDPGRGAVLAQLQQLATTKQTILADDSLSEEEKAEKVITACSVRSVYCVINLVMRVTWPVELLDARCSTVSREPILWQIVPRMKIVAKLC